MNDAIEASAERALEFVEDGQTLGLGTGRAATAFVRALGARVKEGLKVRGVATSVATAQVAQELSIPLLSLEEAGTLDVTFDGADEVDPQLDLIKGYGGALVREKITASSSRRLVILVGPEKMVSHLGDRGKLPVEVIPFGVSVCTKQLQELRCEPALRKSADGSTYVTDNGNFILDCQIAAIEDAAALDQAIQSIPGALGTGLFVGMADAVIIGRDEGPEVLERTAR